MSIPLHRIPKVRPECLACFSTNTRTVMSQAFAAGYHRRHVCKDCDTPFYTLARYDRSKYEIKATPFRDRALTEAEQRQRAEWWTEAEKGTIEVTHHFATEFIESINIVFDKFQKGEELHPDEHQLISKINQLEREFSNG